MDQLSFLSLALHAKPLRSKKFLDEMDAVIPWKELLSVLRTYYYSVSSGAGRRPFDLKLMLKTHCLQQWFDLSDPGMEDAIYDRNSFQQFLGIDLLCDKVPDETTILNFRHLLEEHNLTKLLFDKINSYLEERNLILKEGTSVDATLIAAPKSTKNKKRSRDPEMSSTKKSGNWFFGMKAHIGVQVRGKPLIHSFEASTAKDHDSIKLYDLLHGEEEALFGDKAYDDANLKKACRQQGIFYGISNKAKPKKKLSSKQKRKNKQFSRVRAKVEHPFQIIKHQWGHYKVRYKGLDKNASQFNLLFALANIFMVRKTLLKFS